MLVHLLCVAATSLSAPLPATPVSPQQPAEASASSRTVARTVPPALPRPLASFGAAALGERIFVYGGHTGRAHVHSRATQSGELLCWDGRSPAPAWQVLATGPAVQSPALVAHDELLVRIGGMQARNDDPADEDLWSTATVEGFDLATGTWTALPPLPEARSSHDAALVGTRIVVIGGWQLAGPERRWLDTAWSFDLAAPEVGWRALPAPPFRRRALAVAALGSRVFALGGLDEDGNPSAAVDVLDLDAGAWSRGPDLPEEGFGVAAAAVGGALCASARAGDLWRLDGDRWTTAGTLVAPRFFHRFVATAHGDLLALGGAGKRHLATCELVPTAVTPSSCSSGRCRGRTRRGTARRSRCSATRSTSPAATAASASTTSRPSTSPPRSRPWSSPPCRSARPHRCRRRASRTRCCRGPAGS